MKLSTDGERFIPLFVSTIFNGMCKVMLNLVSHCLYRSELQVALQEMIYYTLKLLCLCNVRF